MAVNRAPPCARREDAFRPVRLVRANFTPTPWRRTRELSPKFPTIKRHLVKLEQPSVTQHLRVLRDPTSRRAAEASAGGSVASMTAALWLTSTPLVVVCVWITSTQSSNHGRRRSLEGRPPRAARSGPGLLLCISGGLDYPLDRGEGFRDALEGLLRAFGDLHLSVVTELLLEHYDSSRQELP